MTYEITLDILVSEYKSALAMENGFWTDDAISTKREAVKKMMREVAENFGKTYKDLLDDVRKNSR